ncbi:hypothetical protein [Salinispora arenicola]|uniref:hypothetical protein n=1 Tax=Salinispora arenicola TaxID=168697 RepID=UPI0004BCFE9B|nr:hypothetical protein [Salinispora arenicola]
MKEAAAFWLAAGKGVPGGYRQRELCEHIDRHGGLKPRWLLRRQLRRGLPR